MWQDWRPHILLVKMSRNILNIALVTCGTAQEYFSCVWTEILTSVQSWIFFLTTPDLELHLYPCKIHFENFPNPVVMVHLILLG